MTLKKLKISGIEFTPKEVDVIACLVCGKQNKTIACLLSVSTRTVEAHIENLKKKLIRPDLEICTSREGIINFIEKERHRSFFQSHYEKIRKKNVFNIYLKKVTDLIRKSSFKYKVIYRNAFQPSFFDPILQNLREVGILVMSPSEEQSQTLDEGILYSEEKEVLLHASDVTHFHGDFYYKKFFDLLKSIIKTEQMDSIFEEFQKEIGIPEKVFKDDLKTPSKNIKFFSRVNKFSFWIGTFCLILIPLFIINQKDLNFFKKDPMFLFDPKLTLPPEAKLLPREDLLEKIEENFKQQEKEENFKKPLYDKAIPRIAIVGSGGSGKTVLAKIYVTQKEETYANILDAKNINNLMSSLLALAYDLARTTEQRNNLKEILANPHQQIKNNMLLAFIQNNLKSYKNWILIYDNVQNYKDISPYFPFYTSQWGHGHVIITTRNYKMVENHFGGKTVDIRKLTPKESLTLLGEILNTKNFSEMENFLTHVPPFPFDIQIAGRYLKNTHITFNDYQKYLQSDPHTFEKKLLETLQDDLPDEYRETRFNIISLAFKELIEKNQDYRKLLLIICLVDSQNIPIRLLEKYATKETVKNFLHDIKKDAIINEELLDKEPSQVFSIHPSTQSFGRIYLINNQEKKDLLVLESLIKAFKEYIEDALQTEKFSQSDSLLARHIEAFLTHESLLKNTSFDILRDKLASVYYRYNLKDYKEIKDCLEKQRKKALDARDQERLIEIETTLAAASLNLGLIKELLSIVHNISLNHYPYFKKEMVKGENSSRSLAYIYSFLGYIYSYLGENLKAREYLERSVEIYQKQASKKYNGYAQSLSYLGDLDRKEGHYDEAEKKVENSIVFYQALEGHEDWAWGVRGLICKERGDFKNALKYLKESKDTCLKLLPKNHEDSALPFVLLGEFYMEIGDYAEAEENLKKSLEIMSKLEKNNIRVLYAKIQLGNLYRLQKKYKASQEILENCYRIYIENFGERSIRVWKVTYYLGCFYMDQKNWDLSEEFLKKALSILKTHKDAQEYKCMESLGDLYAARSNEKDSEADKREFQKKAQEYYQNALEKAQSILNKNSYYVKNIVTKIEHLQNAGSSLIVKIHIFLKTSLKMTPLFHILKVAKDGFIRTK